MNVHYLEEYHAYLPVVRVSFYKTTVEQNNCFLVQTVEQNKKDTILLVILCMQWYISLHSHHIYMELALPHAPTTTTTTTQWKLLYAQVVLGKRPPVQVAEGNHHKCW